MAEAVVEERPAVPTRFYCHMCSVEINIPNTDFTCPLCAGGFVEELPAVQASASSSSASSTSSNPEDAGVSNRNDRSSRMAALRGEIATLLMSRNGQNVEISVDPGNHRGNVLTFGGGGIPGVVGGPGGGGGGGNGGSGSSIGGSTTTGGGRVRSQNFDRLDNVLFDFLQNLQNISGMEANYGNSQMLFMGNLGDYAWGREGIDTIVTQLLNQMETSGPPPLAKNKIDEIPKVAVSAEEVERKLQCSVCWEDFALNETVRKLPCLHIYHEDCIVPWLDLHGTCPICRKSLGEDDNAMETDVAEATPVATETYEATVAAAVPPPPNRSSTAENVGGSNTATGNNVGSNLRGNAGGRASQPPNPPSNVFAFEDGNIDLD